MDPIDITAENENEIEQRLQQQRVEQVAAADEISALSDEQLLLTRLVQNAAVAQSDTADAGADDADDASDAVDQIDGSTSDDLAGAELVQETLGTIEMQLQQLINTEQATQQF